MKERSNADRRKDDRRQVLKPVNPDKRESPRRTNADRRQN